MSDRPLGGRNRRITRSVAPGASPVERRPSAQRTQERRRALIISCGMILAAAATGVVVLALGSRVSVPPSYSTAAMSDNKLRTAKVTYEADGKGCSQQIFDNQTGRMIRSQQPCEAPAYDSNGAPAPVGTIHRLDAISRSFSSH